MKIEMIQEEPKYVWEMTRIEFLVMAALITQVRLGGDGAPTQAAFALLNGIEKHKDELAVWDFKSLKGVGKNGIVLPNSVEDL